MARMDALDAAKGAFADKKKPVKQRLDMSAHVNLISGPAYKRMLRIEPWMRRSIPLLIAFFLIILALVRGLSLYEWRVGIESSSRAALTLSTGHIASAIDRVAAVNGGSKGRLSNAALQDILLRFRSASLVNPAAVIAIVDANGVVVAASGFEPLIGKLLSDQVSDTPALFVMGAGAGIMNVLINNDPAYAAMSETAGYRIFVALSQQKMLADWRKTLSLNITLFAGTVGVMLAILYAYFSQATRARDADAIADRIQQRIDTAMVRGRCGLWDWDMARGRIYWSRSMYEMLGYRPYDALLSVSEVAAVVDPKDFDLYDVARRAMNGEVDHIDINVPMRHSDGHNVWMRIRAEVAGSDEPHLVGISFDVSEQHQFAEQTAKADRRIRDAIENISEAFVLWDADGRLVMSNSKYREHAALSANLLVPGASRTYVEAQARAPLLETVLEGDEEGNTTYERKLLDGKWLKVNERRTEDGGFVSVGTDISALKEAAQKAIDVQKRLYNFVTELRTSRTAQKQKTEQVSLLNEQLKEEKDRAESANRAKSEFLANMSHELRTPLNAIIGFSQMMSAGTFGPLGNERYNEYMEDITKSGTHLLTLINDILDMSKIEAGRFSIDREQLDAATVMSDTLRIMAITAQEKHVALAAKVAQTMPMYADSRALKQIFLNLVSNAVKFTPAGGHVSVHSSIKNKMLFVTIADSGVGIPKTALNKLGQPFEQVENQFTKTHTGSGLGLAISRSLIELHGGTLRIFSREGKGTIVSLRMPVK
ncbi:ATP-binding protein [Bartonella sp. HY406]|uniref:sensor histidine kinase n=1 Tax=Bartonella sp. HY406 TaxID=2979331 RepID=UPI0021C78C0E|nr:ATP-binding protein [Bartonella sp. HY406]UXN04185.1 ATP-binding protein [Bartonella sp. HY406]